MKKEMIIFGYNILIVLMLLFIYLFILFEVGEGQG